MNETKKQIAPPKDKEATLADIVAYQKRRLQNAEPQASSSSLYFVFAFILVLIVAAVLENYDQLTTTSSSSSQTKEVTKRINAPIPKIKWMNTTKSMATDLVEKRVPVVIKGSPVKNWKALHDWRPTYLSNVLTTLSNVKVHTNKDIVFYEDNAPMVLSEYLSSSTKLNHAKSYWKRSKQTVKRMPAEEFFQKASEQLDDSYFYWNGDILGTKLSRDIQPFDFLSPNGKPEYVHLWMGEKGVTAHTHYDVEHNFYVQIYGTKRWTLWPPEMHKQLHLFPRLSPNYRQSQVNYEHPDFKQYPLYTQENSYQVVLEEGDVLYLPPFWFHRVESLDSPADNVIISVNVWSPSADQKAMDDVYVNYAYLPFVDSSHLLLPEVKQHLPKDLDDKSALLITLLTYLKLAQTEIFGITSVIEDLYESRYKPIFSQLTSQQSDFKCPPRIDIPVGLQHLLKSYIRPLKEAFDSVGSSGVKEIHFGNYAEDLIAWQVDLENVDLFLQKCFRT